MSVEICWWLISWVIRRKDIKYIMRRIENLYTLMWGIGDL